MRQAINLLFSRICCQVDFPPIGPNRRQTSCYNSLIMTIAPTEGQGQFMLLIWILEQSKKHEI